MVGSSLHCDIGCKIPSIRAGTVDEGNPELIDNDRSQRSWMLDIVKELDASVECLGSLAVRISVVIKRETLRCGA